ncbi:hypothetical protein CHARACLAT_028066 [Characodon lateralis]|uniref:Uncharacterized protein n=1 Tax=Characodon lateralis TaxID=208331 RepID=A0ABU7EXE1_9TELE|nr:hypothetical protein [Characodon lateralis]
MDKRKAGSSTLQRQKVYNKHALVCHKDSSHFERFALSCDLNGFLPWLIICAIDNVVTDVQIDWSRTSLYCPTGRQHLSTQVKCFRCNPHLQASPSSHHLNH